jgi:hypothetical protein
LEGAKKKQNKKPKKKTNEKSAFFFFVLDNNSSKKKKRKEENLSFLRRLPPLSFFLSLSSPFHHLFERWNRTRFSFQSSAKA